MICLKAYAKINWTLDILGTRPDGYHQMDMLMQSVDLCDTLWIEAADEITLTSAAEETTRGGEDALSSQAVAYDQSNLVYRAALLLRRRCGISAGASIRLGKRIPSGAGMGGGSADAAAALIGLNRLWGLGLDRRQLCQIGLELGADVPFLLTGGLARVQGIGESITLLFPAPRVPLVLMQPCGGLSTGKIFAAYDALAAGPLARPDNAAAQEALLGGDLAALGAAM
ncbi:MAG: 4-(cytidine 5'-diphospho)-2-C-methyl-D-erythritol kinase, partial [Candidatus Limiplasma sp.]|nr:4-(cytidine 5'-diphospho)-2-C-methyl-D-erythritol kinase [Candidatus Limiplasma sp.]